MVLEPSKHSEARGQPTMAKPSAGMVGHGAAKGGQQPTARLRRQSPAGAVPAGTMPIGRLPLQPGHLQMQPLAGAPAGAAPIEVPPAGAVLAAKAAVLAPW
ncbi:hypothetical protein BHE74_00025577 [Ensete ventricosum]|nr:hypothetical protein BHE74_00025577 [Ensete ventricosum]